MNFRNAGIPIFSGIMIVFFIFPFVFLTQYTHLGPDDLCRTGSSFENYFEAIFSWYQNHNGRYVNAVFSLLPVYDLQIYRLILTLSMVVFFLVVHYFIRNLLRLFVIKSLLHSLIFSLIFIVLLLSSLPSLYEIFYWYAGSTVYLYSSIFLLLLLVSLIKFSMGNKREAITVGVLSMLIIGNSEMYIPLTNLILLGLLTCTAVKSKRIPWTILLLNIVCWTSSLLVILAPGSEKRQAIFNGSGQVFFSLSSSVQTALRILWNRFNDPILWVFLLAMLSTFSVAKPTIERKLLVNPLLMLVLSGACFVSVIFVPFYALGFLDYSAGRIIDAIYFIFYILLVLNGLNLYNFIHHKINLQLFSKSTFLPSFLIGGFLFTVAFSSQNIHGVYRDIVNRSYVRLDDDIKKRGEILENSQEEIVVIPYIKGTNILVVDDNAVDDKCFLNHVRSKYNSEIEEIIVESPL